MTDSKKNKKGNWRKLGGTSADGETSKQLEDLTRDVDWDADDSNEDFSDIDAVANGMHALSDNETQTLFDSLGLQSISIRLSRHLLEQFKAFAELEGIGYQPLMRRVLENYERKNRHRLAESSTPLSPEEVQALVRERNNLIAENQRLRELLKK
ncbi:hypothetical protein KF707_17610 [Candidatus Obscuribacterales bacterium]|nr:hypothetical protein [Candidatus Obscuribacterales bacterium]MBX3153828.1 hypothetical protein [Candidatus Obscuribacterales bacterium]